MAGDWIKLEHATPDKPEIAIASEMLGQSLGDTFLVFVRYWIWLDQNLSESRDDLVTFVSRKSIEKKFACPGLASVLEHIKWAEFDDEKQTLKVVNANYHNTNTAKTRALTQKRTKRWRDERVTQSASPEKRREEVVSSLRSETKSASAKQPPPLPEWIDRETWTDYLTMRRAIRKPLTPKGCSLAFSTLERLRAAGHDPKTVLEQSILNSWQGLFPPKDSVVALVQQPAVKWWLSEEATKSKAAELGLSPRGGETWQDFRGRIWERLNAAGRTG